MRILQLVELNIFSEYLQRRRHETAFRNILRTLVPPVEPNSQWEVIRPKIENEEAFITVETEQLREKFFNVIFF